MFFFFFWEFSRMTYLRNFLLYFYRLRKESFDLQSSKRRIQTSPTFKGQSNEGDLLMLSANWPAVYCLRKLWRCSTSNCINLSPLWANLGCSFHLNHMQWKCLHFIKISQTLPSTLNWNGLWNIIYYNCS